MKIALADDHAVVIEGLRLCFEADPDFEVVGIANDGDAIIELVKEKRPDIAIIDITMPGKNGIEAVRTITADADNVTQCIMLSMHRDPAYVREALRAGARAYLVKSSAFDELRTAVDAVTTGKTYISPEIAGELIESLATDPQPQDDTLSKLTPRERQTMKLLAEGNSVKEIAHQLGLSHKTVHTFRATVMQKLQVTSIAELTRIAIRAGMIEID